MIKKIVLAEDDRSTALLVKTLLENKGYQVFTAANGIEALNILKSQPMDLLITDVVMPKMDGVDLYAAVKKDPAISDTPIIIVTDKTVFKESFASLGVSNFVEKSTDFNILLNKIIDVEQQTDKIKKFPKVLVGGNHNIVLEQIITALKGRNYLITTSKTSEGIITKALTMKPHIIVLDVLFQDEGSASEVIKALRCFSSLLHTKIITYAYFPEDLGIDVEAVESVKIAIKDCSLAGADQYIGRFNQSFFLEKINALGV